MDCRSFPYFLTTVDHVHKLPLLMKKCREFYLSKKVFQPIKIIYFILLIGMAFDPPKWVIFEKKKKKSILDAFCTYLQVIKLYIYHFPWNHQNKELFLAHFFQESQVKLYITQLSKDSYNSQLLFKAPKHLNSLTRSQTITFSVKPIFKKKFFYTFFMNVEFGLLFYLLTGI